MVKKYQRIAESYKIMLLKKKHQIEDNINNQIYDNLQESFTDIKIEKNNLEKIIKFLEAVQEAKK